MAAGAVPGFVGGFGARGVLGVCGLDSIAAGTFATGMVGSTCILAAGAGFAAGAFGAWAAGVAATGGGACLGLLAAGAGFVAVGSGAAVAVSVAGGVFAAYIGFLGGDDPIQRVFFAKHLLTASLISAPAAIVAAKMLIPEVHWVAET